jgi:hypothetical protein
MALSTDNNNGCGSRRLAAMRCRLAALSHHQPARLQLAPNFFNFLAKVINIFFSQTHNTLLIASDKTYTAKVPLDAHTVLQTDKLTESETDRRLIGAIILT